MPDKPGDAATNPFGNGAGGAMSTPHKGNDFLTNPSGQNAGKGGTNFLTNPSGGSPKGSQAGGNDFVKSPAGQTRGGGGGGVASAKSKDGMRPTEKGEDPTNPADKAAGPKTAAEATDPKGGDRGGNEVGTVADKATHVPFKGLS